jgi:PKD repeat protein
MRSMRFLVLLGSLVLMAVLSGCFFLFNEPPTALIIASVQQGDCPLAVQFSAMQSWDDEGIVFYTWDFGDGWGGSGATCQHTYTHPGSYTVRLTVEDAYGETDSDTTTIVATATGTYDRRFQWTSHGSTWTWEIAVPKSLHAHYAAMWYRPFCSDAGPCDWYKYVLDPDDDAYIETLAVNLYDAIAPYYPDMLSTYHGFLQFALDFVTAAIPYTLDSLPDEWPRYPLETLVEVAGDCEDTGILYCSIVRSYTPTTHLLFFPTHAAAAVPVSWSFIEACDYSVGYYQYDGAYYVICETTGDPPGYWNVGELPDELRIPWTTGGFWFYDVGLKTGLSAKGLIHEPTN